ncbi:MAG: TRAP transporter large permease subunit, partial [Desulfocapsaceae bacterium]|nr:TRAP transporter large permease subunit [Desulfocapsaceae bacterium]
ENMVLGTLAGSATLGFLIPPSIILIVYGVSTEQSISRLFVAGILPGFMLVTLFMLFIILWALLGRKKLPVDDEQYTFKEKIYRSRRIIPVLLLILGILGSIYSGIASPTDAAAVGVVLALVFSWLTGSMNRETFFGALEGAVLTSCMIAFILAGAAVLTVAMGFTGLPRMLASWIATMELSPYMLLAALTAFFVIMGLFLDGISVVVLTTSIIIPMVEAVGIDLLWFGIFLVLVVEMAQITPPVGFNLFVLQSLTGKDIFYIARAAIPFFIVMVLALVILTIFPELATWLPGKMAF